MSGKPADQDNSIEEILASIRQIISEDDKPAGTAAAAPLEEVPLPAPLDSFAPENMIIEPVTTADDVFELVDRVIAEEEPEAFTLPAPEPAPISFDLPPMSPVAQQPVVDPYVPPAPVVQPAPLTEPVMASPDTPIFTDQAANATLGAFSKLSETILLERQRTIAAAHITLEDIVKELLQPLLRQWIDQHVPGIVDRLVREELEKLSRQAREG